MDGIEGIEGIDDIEGIEPIEGIEGIEPIDPIEPIGAYVINPGRIIGTIPITGCTDACSPLPGSSTCMSSLSSAFPAFSSFFSLFRGTGSPSNSLMNSKYAWSRFRDSSTFLRSWRNGQSFVKCDVSPQMLQLTFAGVKLSTTQNPDHLSRGLLGQLYWLWPRSPQMAQKTPLATWPLIIANSRICACLNGFFASSFTTRISRILRSAAWTSSSRSPVMITWRGSSRPMPSRDPFPSREEPRPRIMIFVCVSLSNLRWDFPRGPRICPTKL